MKFTAAAVLAAAAGASAHYGNNGTTVVTEVVDKYVTYCPGPTSIVHGSKTYTVTEATTLTITDCPCTITKPVMTVSSVICHTCAPSSSANPVYTPVPSSPAAPNSPAVPVPALSSGYSNGTAPAGKPSVVAPTNTPEAGVPIGTGVPPPAGGVSVTSAPTTVPTAGAAGVAALSGAGLVGLVGFVALVL
ncbi:hypothetical protein CDD81_5291 [Ophiocordyceps australis]|uniref:Clock-controlled protein 6 n=1 Tax=Ophiocordyceps australis TaxID=1399860 RepID=A0A2C5XC68_9HYPO|nr:hypothetical protein CDD81_5291 [Ophiocordyceps australis]